VFNLVSILFGPAAAPLIAGFLADVWNLRIAFLVVSPPVYIGACILLRARNHLDADAMKIFEAVVRAMQLDHERAEARAGAHAEPDGPSVGGDAGGPGEFVVRDD
jgi:MFS family permease